MLGKLNHVMLQKRSLLTYNLTDSNIFSTCIDATITHPGAISRQIKILL